MVFSPLVCWSEVWLQNIFIIIIIISISISLDGDFCENNCASCDNSDLNPFHFEMGLASCVLKGQSDGSHVRVFMGGQGFVVDGKTWEREGRWERERSY